MKIQDTYICAIDAQDEDMVANLPYDQTGAFYNLLCEAKELSLEEEQSKIAVIRLEGGTYHFYTEAEPWKKGVLRNINLRCASMIVIEGAPEESGEKTVFCLHGEKQWLSLFESDNFCLRNISFTFAEDEKSAEMPKKNGIFELVTPRQSGCSQLLLSGCSHLLLQRVELNDVSLMFEDCRNISLQKVSGSGEIRFKNCCGALSNQEVSCRAEVLSAARRKGVFYVVEKRDIARSGVL